jgi:undecaprenyl diphosphate synthase
LWASVIQELQDAEKLTAKNKTLTLTMCVNYGGRIELVDAINKISQDVSEGKLRAGSISEKTVQKYLQTSEIPDVDLFLRSSGEQRTSNFLLWQSAYAEFAFDETLWPDFRREHLWQAITEFGNRSRRFGKAVDSPKVTTSK